MTTPTHDTKQLEALRDALLADPTHDLDRTAVCAVAICCDRAIASLTAATPAEPLPATWYCAECKCRVLPVDVTSQEAHVACGRVITDDVEPATPPASPATAAGAEPVELHTAKPACAGFVCAEPACGYTDHAAYRARLHACKCGQLFVSEVHYPAPAPHASDGEGAVCAHGQLARSCDRCEDAATIADLREKLASAEAQAAAARDGALGEAEAVLTAKANKSTPDERAANGRSWWWLASLLVKDLRSTPAPPAQTEAVPVAKIVGFFGDNGYWGTVEWTPYQADKLGRVLAADDVLYALTAKGRA